MSFLQDRAGRTKGCQQSPVTAEAGRTLTDSLHAPVQDKQLFVSYAEGIGRGRPYHSIPNDRPMYWIFEAPTRPRTSTPYLAPPLPPPEQSVSLFDSPQSALKWIGRPRATSNRPGWGVSLRRIARFRRSHTLLIDESKIGLRWAVPKKYSIRSAAGLGHGDFVGKLERTRPGGTGWTGQSRTRSMCRDGALPNDPASRRRVRSRTHSYSPEQREPWSGPTPQTSALCQVAHLASRTRPPPRCIQTTHSPGRLAACCKGDLE